MRSVSLFLWGLSTRVDPKA
uniref:Uncharacterized protein n=1 Tax=Anguilla anguilla TaxID=7936 RepID=A0A0E9TL23_ANGAN